MDYFEYLIGLLRSVTDDEQAVRLLFIGIMAIVGVILAMAFFLLVRALTHPLRKRVTKVATGGEEDQSSANVVSEAMQPLSEAFRPKEQTEVSKAQRRMRAAGFRSDSAVAVFAATKLILVVLLPALVFVGATATGGLPATVVVLMASIAGLLGLLVPALVVDSRTKARVKRIRDGFPDALDMIVVCAEAGLGLRAAIARVADELVVSYPDLSDELALVNAEMRAGIDRVQALRNFADRSGVEEIRGFVAVLSQAMKFGTSVAETLRTYSVEFREKRMQRAEELAGKIPIKMLFPMVLFIFPSLFVVGVAPAVLRVIEALQGT
jgi:tight adherence protein C